MDDYMDRQDYWYRVMLGAYQLVMLLGSGLATGLGCLAAWLSYSWQPLLWGLLAIPIGLLLAYGLPWLHTVVGQPVNTQITRLRIRHGGYRDIARLAQTTIDLSDEGKK